MFKFNKEARADGLEAARVRATVVSWEGHPEFH